MNSINDLMYYLRPERIENDTYKYKTIIPVDLVYNPINTAQQIENGYFQKHYLGKNIIKDDDGRITLYVRTGDDGLAYWYYVKRILNPPGEPSTVEYRRLSLSDIYGWETLTALEISELKEIVIDEIGKVYIHKTELHLVVRILDAVVKSGGFIYNPDDLSTLQNGNDYMMDYVDHEGYGIGLWDSIQKSFWDSEDKIDLDRKDRTLNLNFNQSSGPVHWYPRIKKGFIFNNLSLEYYYINYYNDFYHKDGVVRNPSRPIRFEFLDTLGPKAIELKFNSIYGLLMFLNQTILRQHIDFDADKDSKPKPNELDQQFVSDYIELVTDAYKSRMNNAEELYKLFYYLPTKALFEFPVKLLWDFIERAVQRPITNIGTNKEDILLKLLKILSQNDKPKNFLDRMIEPIKSSTHILERLTNRFHGESYTEFVYLIWSVWANSSYFSFDKSNPALPKDKYSPLLIPYKSDTTLSFHTDNASIYWKEDYTKIKVDLDLPDLVFSEPKMEPKSPVEIALELAKNITFGFANIPTLLDKEVRHVIAEKYLYHPFCPIAIVNKNNPKFIFKGGGEDKEFVTIMPAFVLLAREERAFWANLMTAGEYIIDLLSLAGGYASILKGARLLATINSGKSVFLQFAKAGVKQTAGAIFITSGVGRGLVKITEIQDTKLGQAISQVLFYLEIAAILGEIGVGLHTLIQKSAINALKFTDEINAIRKEVEELRLKNTDEFGNVNKSKELAVAEEKLAAIAKLEEIAGVDLIQKVSRRGRKFGQKISQKQMNQIKVILDKMGVKLQIFPKDGSHVIEGFFVGKNIPAEIPDSAAAMFITDGINMKIVLREESTLYEFFHEFMHFRHSQAIGLENYYKLGGYGSSGELIKEMWVFEKMVSYQNFMTKAEIEHALRYINRVNNRFGNESIVLDISNLPNIRKEISIKSILNTK